MFCYHDEKSSVGPQPRPFALLPWTIDKIWTFFFYILSISVTLFIYDQHTDQIKIKN